jgi:hypothetical protein
MEDSVESVEKSADSGISPGVVFLVALLSIGGLMFVSWIGTSSSITGGAVVSPPYAACCTASPSGTSMAAYRQGTAQTWTALCNYGELASLCCVRSGRDRFRLPVNLLGSTPGTCETGAPETVYPFGQYSVNSFNACCTIKKWGTAPAGAIMSEGITSTEACNPLETPYDCCARAGFAKTQSTIRVTGARMGNCNPPEITYPAPAPKGAYPACCTTQNWQQSPMGYAQSEARTQTQYCDQLETAAQCCLRNVGAPVKLLGARYGACGSMTPDLYYPAWIKR